MESFLFVCLALLADPVRWLVCLCAAWFVRSYIGALTLGIGAMFGISVALTHSNGPTLLVGCIASAAIVSVFYFWRQGRRRKAQTAT